MIAAALVAAALAAGPEVTVALLAKQAPRELVLRGPGRGHAVAARGDALWVDGREASSLALPPGAWNVLLPGQSVRGYRAALSLRARGGRVELRATMELEEYVASVVASESLPGTPPAALQALAVVVRSYALSARSRHEGGALCDLAHCQVLRGSGIREEQRAAAERAARTTAGEVLRLGSGETAEATFHAACGGHTASPLAAFGSGASGAVATPDPGCEARPWRAEIAPTALSAALRAALSRAGRGDASAVPAVLRASDLALLTGPGGWVGRVEGRDGGFAVSGDAFARALDAALGRGRVRSSRFALADEGGAVVVRGSGHGHGVGLCQRGAARHAAAGEGYRELLGRYFDAKVSRRP